jgi:hypothetical protein
MRPYSVKIAGVGPYPRPGAIGRRSQNKTPDRVPSDDKLPFAMVVRLWDWMRWVECQAGVKRWVSRKFQGPEASGVSSPARMSDAEWDAFDGWCGHQHVPGNSHWDPGKLDVDAVTRITRPGTPRCEVAHWF